MQDREYLGFVRYQGTLVQDGLMDARQQARALVALDSALRHFISKQAPSFRHLDFEIPVRVRQGSWEALIPVTAAGWAKAGLGVVATAYLTKAAQKMAERDFEDFGLTDLFRNSIEGLKWFARIGKHMGDAAIRRFNRVEFVDNNALIGIRNSNGEVLYVPKKILDLYIDSSPRLLEELAENVDEGRELTIGTITDGQADEESIGTAEKPIFCSSEDELEEDVLFPELVHGEDVVLEGEVTRGNKTSNSMGFRYKEHILTSYPESGSIVPYKPLLFLKCRLFGTVSRLDEKGRIAARKPRLLFRDLEPLESDNDLFDTELS